MSNARARRRCSCVSTSHGLASPDIRELLLLIPEPKRYGQRLKDPSADTTRSVVGYDPDQQDVGACDSPEREPLGLGEESLLGWVGEADMDSGVGTAAGMIRCRRRIRRFCSLADCVADVLLVANKMCSLPPVPAGIGAPWVLS